jgi:L-ascorbate metabolism protein UlaG (beta-lactamase superfamily)
MTIQWFGQSFFKINTKNSVGEDVVVAIDPFDKSYGLKVPTKFGADIVLISHEHKDHNNVDAIKGTNLSPEPFVVSGPGEYEVKGVMIYGIPAFHDDQEGAERGDITMFLIESEGIWLAHLSDLGQKTLEDSQLEQLRDVDVLMTPVGGTFTINAKEASKIISQVEPRVVIPMHYNLPGLKFKSGAKLDGVDKFIKEEGIKSEEIEGKLKINKKDLPQDETSLYILNAKN